MHQRRSTRFGALLAILSAYIRLCRGWVWSGFCDRYPLAVAAFKWRITKSPLFCDITVIYIHINYYTT